MHYPSHRSFHKHTHKRKYEDGDLKTEWSISLFNQFIRFSDIYFLNWEMNYDLQRPLVPLWQARVKLKRMIFMCDLSESAKRCGI